MVHTENITWNAKPFENTIMILSFETYEPRHEKICFSHMRTTKVQISLRIRCLDSIIALLVIAKIWKPKLISSAEQASISLTWSKIPKTGFLVMRLIQTSANCADPERAVWSVSAPLTILPASFWTHSLIGKQLCSNFRTNTIFFFRCFDFSIFSEFEK